MDRTDVSGGRLPPPGLQAPQVRADAKLSWIVQVTQRPGCSCFATSVSTLTTGSQARVRATGCLLTAGAGELLRASLRATGTRTRIEVSERPSTETEIVRVCSALA